MAPSGDVSLLPLDGDGSGDGSSPSKSADGSESADGSKSASGGGSSGTETDSNPGAAPASAGAARGGSTSPSSGSGGTSSDGSGGNSDGTGGGSGGSHGGSGGGGTSSSPAPTQSKPGTGAGPAVLGVGTPSREATDQRWCEKVTVSFRNTGGTAVRSGTVTFGTHIIGALGIDWATIESTEDLPAPIAAGAKKDKTWTVCVDAWRVPLGMHIETRDVSVQWK
ncbi:hypothetical protein ACFVXW_23760 [Streptomyces sp. NPDC058251]|uniref:hypothetical protein n=1 Tax=Streptomyces sp. NPDC058251 TaxID=3346404 RepID=UPI0036ED1EF4